jgi:hypothetical protein
VVIVGPRRVQKFKFRSGVVATIALSLVLMTGVLDAHAATFKRSLHSELVTIGQMPKGWSVPVRSDVVNVKCLASILVTNGAASASIAQAVFTQDGGLPAVAEKLETFANASSAYAKSVTTLASCKHLSGSINAFSVSGTVKPMTTRRYGTDSQAFHVTISMLGVPAAIDVQIIRQGNVIMWLDSANFPPVNVTQFKSLVAKAFARVR